jgi:hypothetical protein
VAVFIKNMPVEGDITCKNMYSNHRKLFATATASQQRKTVKI